MWSIACEPVPSAPQDAVPIDPPAIYRQWYREAEACRGLGGYYGLLRFYLVPNSGSHRELGIHGAIGRWAPPHRIYLLEGYSLDEPTIKHEMLHDLLSYIGDFTHNRFAGLPGLRPDRRGRCALNRQATTALQV